MNEDQELANLIKQAANTLFQAIKRYNFPKIEEILSTEDFPVNTAITDTNMNNIRCNKIL